MAKFVTIADVAARAGVSASAVSRAFTPGASVSPRTRKKVRDAAEALRYRPNLVARALSKRQKSIIAVVATRLENGFNAELLQAIAYEAGAQGFRVLLFTSDRATDADPPAEDILLYRPDGCILLASRSFTAFAEECRHLGVPLVLVNRRAQTFASSVTGDNRCGGREIAAHLLAAGHTRFAFMAGMEDASTSREREQGFTEELRRHGHSVSLRLEGRFDAGIAEAAARDMLAGPSPPDALFCANDHMAIAALDVARREFGLTPGRELSIIGFDDSFISRYVGLTTFSQPAQEMAKAAVDLIVQRIASGEARIAARICPGRLILRESARRVK